MDGIFCREIAKRFLTPTPSSPVEFIGWDYGDPEPVIPIEEIVYILDLSVPTLMWHPGLIWIDHHKSAIDRYSDDIPGYRIDGVAACRLAWQFFSRLQGTSADMDALPTKPEYVDRKVVEPQAVRMAGEYDVWDKRDGYAETFQFGLRSGVLSEKIWHDLLSDVGGVVGHLLEKGHYIQDYQQGMDANTVNHRGYLQEFDGLTFLALNAKGNSLTFAARDIPETGHDALLLWNWDGQRPRWRVSLYHAKHRTDLDLSTIASKHGGGGHRGACGFECERLPWLDAKPKNALAKALA